MIIDPKMVEDEQPQKSNLAWRINFYGESIVEAKKSAEKIEFWVAQHPEESQKKISC